MNDDQKKQWLEDVKELGDRAFTLWEYCFMEDRKNGKYWKRMFNNFQVSKNREFRRVPNPS